jgi:hypothetical protein
MCNFVPVKLQTMATGAAQMDGTMAKSKLLSIAKLTCKL